MKKIIIIAATIILSATARCIGQVTVSPEIGISYLPFILHGATLPGGQSNRIDYLFGISGSLPISKQWYINVRASYVQRETVKWLERDFFQTYSHEYKHNDLNIDFNINYKITEILHVGAGTILIRKINSTESSVPVISGPSYSYAVNGFQYGIQSLLSADLRFVIVKLEYARKIIYSEPYISGQDRYNLTLAFPIRKRGKR